MLILTHHLGLAAVPERQVSEEAAEVVAGPAEGQVLYRNDVARQRGVLHPGDGLLLRVDRVRASVFDSCRNANPQAKGAVNASLGCSSRRGRSMSTNELYSAEQGGALTAG